MSDGEIIGGRYKVVGNGPIAIIGKDGCHDPRCRRVMGEDGCRGYHCPHCDQPCSMMGHAKCIEAAND